MLCSNISKQWICLIQKFGDISNHENNLFCVKPLETFLGKSLLCNTTIMSGALDKSDFDGNTFLPKISQENNKNKYVYISGDVICFFLTNDDIYK